MIRRAVEYARKIFFLSPEVPRHLDIEVSTACNLACKMCKREKVDFGNQLMPFDQFVRIVDRLPVGVEMVSFGGYGEMLLHPRFFDLVRYAKSKGFYTETTSNGTLLDRDERILKLLDSGLDSLRISVDHVTPPREEADVGHVFSAPLLRSLRRLSQVRAERRSPIRLGINTVVHKGNANEIPDIIRLADEIRADLVELIRLDTCLNNAERTLPIADEAALYAKIHRMKTRTKVVTPANRFAKWRRLYNLKRDFCPLRYQSAHVRLNGAVTPCSFGFATSDFGSIHERALVDIWQAQAFKAARENDQNPICSSCSIFKWGRSSARPSDKMAAQPS